MSEKILLVDDDTSLSKALCDFLQAKGYSVDVFEECGPAWDYILNNTYNLIILDWDLPDSSGVELCRAYRDHGGVAPVLMMTGRKELEDKEVGLEAGADDYVTKPFSLRELHARIKSMMRRATTYTPQVPVHSDPSQPAAGLIIAGKYQLEEPIGTGGMSWVWKAKDTVVRRTVVVKLMHRNLVDDGESARRFQQECMALARLNHPNIITIYDAGTVNDRIPFIAMEYVQGNSLRVLLEKKGPASIKTTIKVMTQICAGLQEAHDAGVIHRDLKPDNILLHDKMGRIDAVKIVDFGIARLLDSKERITRDNMVCGTVEYISPEQLSEDAVDCRADIYAMGIMLFELLTGALPFEARSLEGMMMKHLTGTPELLSAKCEKVAPGSELEQIVLKCLSRKPDDRFQTAKELQDTLDSINERISNT